MQIEVAYDIIHVVDVESGSSRLKNWTARWKEIQMTRIYIQNILNIHVSRLQTMHCVYDFK